MSAQTTLFETNPITGNRCKNCVHIYDHTYGKMKYCEEQNDSKTSYGHKKIKANYIACDKFVKK